ncbi:MAG: malonyl-CoA decarboxylase [Burkholderiaceae bacterium]
MMGVSYFQDLLNSLFERSTEPGAGRADSRSLSEICEALLSERGEVSGQVLACTALERFESLDDAEQIAFFELFTNEFDIDAAQVVEAATNYGEQPSIASFKRLRTVAEPRRQELLRRLNSAPGATHRLVQMREKLLAAIASRPELARADQDFQHLFASWFNRGFLVMRHIDWQSPASLLEKIIAYEAVHAIHDWDDLRRRLQPADRRCFAFFHPAMPDEPLIFVEVALLKGKPDSIEQVLANDREPIDPDKTDTAIFYSISNCQNGLKGVSFGNFLIKQVAQDLAEELPQLKHFMTLSPVPGLSGWVQSELNSTSIQGPGVDRDVLVLIDKVSKEQLLAPDSATQKAMLGTVAQYFCQAKRLNGLPVDPVARFHLGNGASLDRIIFGADLSPKGIAQSASIMVNYRYDLTEVGNRHQAYVSKGEVHTSKAVRALLDEANKNALKKKASSIESPSSASQASE